jgi:hypothetical protein
MDLKAYVEGLLVQQKETEAVILEIYKSGSQLLRSEPHDLDFQVVCSGYKQRFTYNKVSEDGVDYDIFIIDKEALIRELTFGNTNYIQRDLRLWNYFHAIRESVYGDCGIVYDIFDHEDQYLSYIKDSYLKRVSSGRPLPRTHGKLYIHYYMVLKIYQNHSVEITEGMRSELDLLYNNSDLAQPIMDWVIEELDKL